MNPFRKLTWNIYSTIVAPLLILFVCFAVLIPGAERRSGGFYLLPLYALVVISASSLLFWIFRILSLRQRKLRKVTFVLGLLCGLVGLSATLGLVFLSLVRLLFGSISEPAVLDYPTDFSYWFISLWAILEGIHHYVYRMLYRPKMGQNVGGTIGIQTRKLKSHPQ